MRIEIKKSGFFGGVKSRTLVTDDCIVIDDKTYQIANIISFYYDENLDKIDIVGINKPLDDQALMGIYKQLLTCLPEAANEPSDYFVVIEHCFLASAYDMYLNAEPLPTESSIDDVFNIEIDCKGKAFEANAIVKHLEVNSMRNRWLAIRRKATGSLAPAQKPTTPMAQPYETNEIRKICNVCGTVFCYTKEDLEKNASGAFSSMALQIGGALTGNFGASVYGKQTEDEMIDYSRCPNCNSRNITTFVPSGHKKAGDSSTNSTSESYSEADEIAKFKELLDIGAITQEEYDAKKKQILNL